jgi:PAS domain S-box-containing protein
VTAATTENSWASFFWAAFERSKNAMALLDADRVLLAVNRALEASFGYTADQLIGRRADLFLAPDDWKRADAAWTHVLRSDHVVNVRHVLRSDGREVRVQGAAVREIVTGRNLVLFVVIDERLMPVAYSDVERSELARLTPRELEIVTAIAMGRRVNEIAADLGIAPVTVHTHVRNAMRKVGARSQAQLVAIAFARGLVR